MAIRYNPSAKDPREKISFEPLSEVNKAPSTFNIYYNVDISGGGGGSDGGVNPVIYSITDVNTKGGPGYSKVVVGINEDIGQKLAESVRNNTAIINSLQGAYTSSYGNRGGWLSIAYQKAAEDANKIASELSQTGNQFKPEQTNWKTVYDNEQKEVEKNKATNIAYKKLQDTAYTTQGKDYIAQRSKLDAIEGIDDTTKQQLKNVFIDFYQGEKLAGQMWSSTAGAKPPAGEFDPKYYESVSPEAKATWDQAFKTGDLDLLATYGNKENFYLWHYTTQGKPGGKRGNAVKPTAVSETYTEKLPDNVLAEIRNRRLGLGTAEQQTQRLLNIPEVQAQWEKAKGGDPYWALLGKQKGLNPEKEDEFAALFRLSDRPEDKQVQLVNNTNVDYGITQLEDAVNQSLSEKTTVDLKKFGALSQSILKDTIAEITKARTQEQTMSMLGNLSGFKEIMDANKEITNSIMGDSGLGGVLSFTGKGKEAEDSLEKSLQNITGIRNSVTYNWQQWFDKTLKEKYSTDQELGYKTDTANEQIKVDAAFARDFIDKYLTPRFNTSKSMDEFVDYIDVKQNEQNPFQTQTTNESLRSLAQARSNVYLDQLSKAGERKFDSAFYFNPTGNESIQNKYADQAKTVADDWEKAKQGDPYWTEKAYEYGTDLNDKDAFARLHYQVVGQFRQYDPAEDIVNESKINDFIYKEVLPALQQRANDPAFATIFGQFITPEEFANKALEGADPLNNEQMKKILEKYGVGEYGTDLNSVKTQLADIIRTGSAATIRDAIKTLQEEGEKPTQENLGITYIERPEDASEATAKTKLYEVFKSAGYAGDEDTFYKEFMPDADRSSMELLTKATSKGGLQMIDLNMSDPFSSLGSMEDLFAEADNIKEEQDKTESSYFKLGLDDEEDADTNEKADDFFGGLSSLFK